MDCGKSTQESSDRTRQSDFRRKERLGEPVKLDIRGDDIVPLSKRKKAETFGWTGPFEATDVCEPRDEP